MAFSDVTIATYFRHRAAGVNRAAAARLSGVSTQTAMNWDLGNTKAAEDVRQRLLNDGLVFTDVRSRQPTNVIDTTVEEEAPESKIKTFWRSLYRSGSIKIASEESGLSYKHSRAIAQGKIEKANAVKAEMVATEGLSRGPVPYKALSRGAKKAYDNFGYFRVRYLGRCALPWQTDAANQILAYLEGDRNDPFEINYLLINCPPGAGKTTLLRDICTWLIVRNRSIRVMWGSRTDDQASENVELVRDVLGSPLPVFISDGDKLRRGAVEPTGCLADDFGSFRPNNRGNWGSDGFTVSLPDGAVGSNKEQTMTAYGAQGDALGKRVDIAVWDDLADDANIRTATAQKTIRDTLDQKLEYRVEPGGLFVLVGQRLHPDDIYGYARDKRSILFDEDGEEIADEDARLYHHIVYPAHDEANCKGIHLPKQEPKPWPEGCLLDPRALSWARLRTEMVKNDANYRVVFQQEDIDPEHTLVKKVWIDGGTDIDGVTYPGAWDERAPFTRPNMDGNYWTAITVDPSGEKLWAVQMWAVHLETKFRFLIATHSGRMKAPELLEQQPSGEYTGKLAEFALAARRIGLPVRHVIVENNAAQRYLLQYGFFTRWCAMNNIQAVAHKTDGSTKLDPDRGIETVRTPWKFSQVRLPGTLEGRQMCARLVTEATHYPYTVTTDQLMAQWFLEFWLPTHGRPKRRDSEPAKRPSWLDGSDRRAVLRRVS